MAYSKELQSKINLLKAKITPRSLGRIALNSPLVMAPLAGITTAPFRILMQELGAGFTVSELISCHAAAHGNAHTIDMLTPSKLETNVGMQLFGEDQFLMAEAARIAESKGAKFIDINMGCPVRKVVTKGGGSALLTDPKKINDFFRPIRDAIKIPLTAKIRSGWDDDHLNADEVIDRLVDSGVEMISMHGRTRAQQYEGFANWDYIEKMAEHCSVPFIGNGDLNTPLKTFNRLQHTNCSALMLGRGPLRHPFIFLQAFDPDKKISFNAKDHFEVLMRYLELMQSDPMFNAKPRTILVQWLKLAVWFAAGYPQVAAFRNEILRIKDLNEAVEFGRAYFLRHQQDEKKVNEDAVFLNGGHG